MIFATTKDHANIELILIRDISTRQLEHEWGTSCVADVQRLQQGEYIPWGFVLSHLKFKKELQGKT